MSDWGTADAELYRILCDHGEANLLEVHIRTRLSPANLYFAATRLVDLGLADFDEMIVKRSAQFELKAIEHRWAVANRPRYWMAWDLDDQRGAQ